jgi:hypothetical protein
MKPVAWMLVDKDWNDACRYFSFPMENAIPLYTAPRELSDEEILEAIEEFREWTNPPYKAYEDTYMDGWLDACNEIYSAVFEILKKASEK